MRCFIVYFWCCIIIGLGACSKAPISSNHTFLSKLSEYQVFAGSMQELNPSNGFVVYELATELFSDYAEKQRLIKVPTGTQLTQVNDELPTFPNGTILVKTFYYYHDKRDPNKGKQVIETRLLIKENDAWSAATYLWNTEQTEAFLLKSGYHQNVNWIDENGEGKVLSYRVPMLTECDVCHQNNDALEPIGPKLRNLNMDVQRNSQLLNQLQYFQNVGLINTFNPQQIDSLPIAFGSNRTMEERARAYLDINCTACHKLNGHADDVPELYFDYHLSFDETKIADYKEKIIKEMEKGDMPSVATSVIDEEGLELVQQYINSL